jgi:hypothetical protein
MHGRIWPTQCTGMNYNISTAAPPRATPEFASRLIGTARVSLSRLPSVGLPQKSSHRDHLHEARPGPRHVCYYRTDHHIPVSPDPAYPYEPFIYILTRTIGRRESLLADSMQSRVIIVEHTPHLSKPKGWMRGALRHSIQKLHTHLGDSVTQMTSERRPRNPTR